MTLEEAFGPSINVYRNVLITRVSSGHEISSKDSISCTYDYVELDNGITLKNLKVPRSRYELIDENHRLQTRADLYVDDSELIGGTRTDGKIMLHSRYTDSAFGFMEIFGFIFFGGMLWLGLALFFHSFERSREGGMLFSAFLSMVGIWALRL